jgi:hypothetical protein
MLQESESKCVVHLEERPDDRVGQPLLNQLAARHVEVFIAFAPTAYPFSALSITSIRMIRFIRSIRIAPLRP